MADFKWHTAQRIIGQLEAGRCEWLLNQLRYFRAAHQSESEHQVWQEGFHPQAIVSDEMMVQSRAERARHSSAYEWAVGAMPVLRCEPWR